MVLLETLEYKQHLTGQQKAGDVSKSTNLVVVYSLNIELTAAPHDLNIIIQLHVTLQK